jgi:ATP-binding cassette subfamily F protein uup
MAPPLLHLRDIHLTFGGTPLLADAELMLWEGERICLVGRNGSGKSTLLRIAAGLLEPDKGAIWRQPGTTVRYLPQEPDLAGHASVLSYVEAGLGPADDRHRCRYLLDALGLSGEEAPARLSGGETRRAALARVLAASPDVLLLDEPTNHLDIAAIEWLESELRNSRAAMVLISHDRRFLTTLSSATVWLDRGTARRLSEGFGAFEAWRDKVLEEEAAEQHRLGRKIAREEDWLRYGVTARRRRNARRLADLKALRRQKREAIAATGKVTFEVSEGESSGRLVIEAKAIGKRFGARSVVAGLSLMLLRGDRLAIIGPNGAGKTTLLRLLTGMLAPDEGTVRLGANLQMVVLDQGREALDPAATLAEAIAEGRGDAVMVNGKARHVAGYMKDYLFAPEQARTPVGVLSGGERARIMLARAFARPSNLMVLDEPTNDLDLETLDLLEEKIDAYRGTVLLVSHDRDFIDRIATSSLRPEGDGHWQEYAGGYSDMEAQRRHQAVPGKPSPVRVLKPEAEKPNQARPVKRKLSFKDKHALQQLPGEIAALEAEIAALEARLADPEFFTRDAAAFEKASQRLAAARAALAGKEETWLRLEMRREEFEGAGSVSAGNG